MSNQSTVDELQENLTDLDAKLAEVQLLQQRLSVEAKLHDERKLQQARQELAAIRPAFEGKKAVLASAVQEWNDALTGLEVAHEGLLKAFSDIRGYFIRVEGLAIQAGEPVPSHGELVPGAFPVALGLSDIGVDKIPSLIQARRRVAITWPRMLNLPLQTLEMSILKSLQGTGEKMRRAICGGKSEEVTQAVDPQAD